MPSFKFSVLTDWRKVKYKKCKDDWDETIINDCNKWLFFGDTMSRGKKSDHVFHNNCLSYLIKFYNEERDRNGQDKIPTNILQTDNCNGQFKVHHTFLQVATSCNSRDTAVIHKFVQKYKFKGSWDIAGNLVKQTIHCLEIKNVRVTNTKDCYEKLGKELTKTGKEKYIKNMLEYKQTGDKKVLENTILRTRHTFVGFGTKEKDEYEKPLQAGKKHNVLTDRGHVKDMKAIKGIQKLSQVQGAKKA
eukprot:9342488-Ditylum_brightwellii.AAC.1